MSGRSNVQRLRSASGRSEVALRAAQDLIDSRRLFYFYHVARLRSFSAAEAVLDIAQPAMSRQIAQLESDLGAQLLERSPRGVTLTAVGSLVFRHAEGILDDMSRVRSDVESAARVPVGQISIAVPTFFVRRFLPDVLSRFSHDYPGIRLRVIEASTGQVSELLAAGSVDLAVVLQAPASAKVLTQPLLSENMDLVVAKGHPLAARRSIERRELDGLPFCMPVNPHGARELFERWCKDGGIRLDVRMEADSLYLTKYAIRHLNLLCFLPAADCEASDEIVNVPLSPPIVRTQYLAQMRDREQPLLLPLANRIKATVERAIARRPAGARRVSSIHKEGPR